MVSGNPEQLRSEVVRIAEQWVGLEFKPGHGEQCAAFVRAVFAEAGLSLPVARTPSDLERTRDLPQGPAFANSLSSDEAGRVVALPELRPGDLALFRDTYQGDFPPHCITHVGICVGGGEMIHHSTAAGPVQKIALDDWWFERLAEIRRPYFYSVSGARERVVELCQGHWVQRAIAAAVELEIVEFLEDQPCSLVELADRRSLHVPSLERLMRGLCAIGLFTLDGDGRYRNTELSGWMVRDRQDSIRDYLLARSRAAEWTAWLSLRSCIESGRPVRGPAGDPPRAWIGAVAEALWQHFARDGSPRLVDLGGAESGMLFEVLALGAGLRATVRVPRERAEAVRQAVQARGLEGRLEIWPGDLPPATLPEGDLYLLPLVLCELDDADAVALLQRLRELGARVILVEFLEEESPFRDLQALVLGIPERERPAGNLRELCARAGWRFGRVFSTPTPLGLVELVGDTQEN